MNSTREPLRSGDAIAAAQLRGLLDLARLSLRDAGIDDVLASVAESVSQTLGFGVVVINVYRPATDEYEVRVVHGAERARRILLGDVAPAASWAPMLAPRFGRGGVFFVPEGSLEWDAEIVSYVPQRAESDAAGESAWRPGDALFASLDGAAGRHFGIISVDEPSSGRRPDDRELEVLSAVAAHAALAIESVHQVAALQEALVRNRAVIDSALDCVIAIDKRGRVLEFNPAAERTFGYRLEEARGRELAELIIPPEHREAHRRGLERGLAHDDWRLLGRRIEMTALHADGTRLPVELSLTLVPGSPEQGPLVYGFVRDISERRRGEEQLAYLAYHDPLTGLPNRILVEQQLDLALARARRSDGSVVLMFVDLDDFKEVNDRLGHAAGDRLLAAVATRLRAVLRDTDLLARQGGDEFILLLTDLADDPGHTAELVGGKLLDALREPFVVAGAELRTGASVGISVYPDDAADTEALLRNADVAMYRAKTAGGNRLSFHRPAGPGLSPRSSLSAQLRRAIAGSELELCYQPFWRLDGSRTISGVEALLRWRHPDRGLLAPDAFVPMADQSTVADELVDWVLAAACRQARAWQDEGLRPRVSVNVSPHQLLAAGFATRFGEQVSAHGLRFESFMIELMESAWTVDAAETLQVIAELRAAGAWLAIDDFGAGYSSLSRLRELDFDVIKIDRGLLSDVPDDRTAVAVLRAIVDLARACGSAIVAQGVETEAQRRYLAANGVDQAQGFLFGRPVTAAELTPLLRESLPGEREAGRPVA